MNDDIRSTSYLQSTASVLRISPLWQGVLWKLLSCACFAGINGIVRYLNGGGQSAIETPLPSSVILFFQNVFGTILLLPFVIRSSRVCDNRKTLYPQTHLMRILAAVLGVLLWYLALQRMTIAEAVALSFTGPIFTVMGARMLLGELLGKQRIWAVILSLVGAFVISRPDLVLGGNTTAGFSWAICLPLGSAIALAWNKLLTRKLANLGENPKRLALYLLLGMAPISYIPALYEWTTPSFSHWQWLVCLGVLASLAHVSFGKAYALAEVTFLTPFGFSKFIFSTLIGYGVFLEVPCRSLWLGMAIISLSIFLLMEKMSLSVIARWFRIGRSKQRG